MKRFKKEDFKLVHPQLSILIQIQQARFDKKNSDSGLSLQEDAEYLGITNLLLFEEKEQDKLFPTIKDIINEWLLFKDDQTMNEDDVVERFDSFICSLMSDLGIK